MKKNVLFICSTFLFCGRLNAKSSYFVLGGHNYSSFRTTESETVEGYTFGIGSDWPLFYNLSIGLEATYTSRGGFLKNKIVGGRETRYVHLHDIYCSFRSIEIPLLLRYKIPIKNDFTLKFVYGYALSIGHKNKSRVEIGDFLFEVNNPDEWDNIKYDYDYNMDPGGPIPSIARSSGFVLCTGIGIQWSLLKLEFIYARDFFDIDTINTVYLHERIHTYRLLVGIVLNPQ